MAVLDKEKIRNRLSEAFGMDTQETVGKKLGTTQGNVSKWLKEKGQQIPTPDMLIEIAKAYKVSIDWLLGISDQKEVDGVSLEKLTYEQIARIMDKLIQNRNVEIPNLAEVNAGSTDDCNFEEETKEKPEPCNDSDYIKINDRLLSYLLRRRYKIQLTGEDMLDLWRDNKLPNFKELKLLAYSENMEKAIDTRSWATYNDADWIDFIRELGNLTEEELEEIVKKAEEKEGKNNG